VSSRNRIGEGRDGGVSWAGEDPTGTVEVAPAPILTWTAPDVGVSGRQARPDKADRARPSRVAIARTDLMGSFPPRNPSLWMAVRPVSSAPRSAGDTAPPPRRAPGGGGPS